MSDEIKAKKLIRPLNGVSKPQLIRFSDGNAYAVKFQNNPQATRALVNEYIAARLAEELSLPVPPVRVVSVSHKFIKRNLLLRQQGFEPGVQFASLYIKKSSTLKHFPTPPEKHKIVNRRRLAGMVVFDLWLNNLDRQRKNLLLKSSPLGYKVMLIDHGNCFPGAFKWSTKTLKRNKNPRLTQPVHSWAAAMLSRRHFTKYVQKIQDLPAEKIEEIIDSVPDEWNVSKEEKKQLYKFLKKRKKKLDDLVEAFLEMHKGSMH